MLITKQTVGGRGSLAERALTVAVEEPDQRLVDRAGDALVSFLLLDEHDVVRVLEEGPADRPAAEEGVAEHLDY